MKRLRTGVVCLSGVIVAAGMAMAGPPGPVNPNIKGRPQVQLDPRPAPSRPAGGTPGTRLSIPAMPSVPKKPVQFSAWSRVKKRWTPDVAKNLYTVIYEGGPKDPNHFYAYGFDVKRRQNVFFVTGDLKDLPKFRSMLPPPPPPDAPAQGLAASAWDAGTPVIQSPPNIAQLPGGEPPPPPPEIHDGDPWMPYAYLAWTSSIEMVRIANPSTLGLGNKVRPIKATPSP